MTSQADVMCCKSVGTDLSMLDIDGFITEIFQLKKEVALLEAKLRARGDQLNTEKPRHKEDTEFSLTLLCYTDTNPTDAQDTVCDSNHSLNQDESTDQTSTVSLDSVCNAVELKEIKTEPKVKEEQNDEYENLGDFVPAVKQVNGRNLGIKTEPTSYKELIEEKDNGGDDDIYLIPSESNRMDQGLILRVIINDGDIRKITLQERPASVEAFTMSLIEKLQLRYDFTLQFEDPDFNNALCNLTDMGDLPNKTTLKIIPRVLLVGSDTSPCTTDIEMSSSGSFESSSKNQWPKFFEIPDFSFDVNHRLRQGDLLYTRNGTYHLMVSKDMKHEILHKLAECIYSFKAYPTDKDFAEVAKALINKHPCLREKGSCTGYYGWKNSLKFKMGNYRSKLRKAGCLDVMVNGGRKSKFAPEGQPPKLNIKKPRRDETNYLPNFPLGKDEISLERDREFISEEIRKRTPNTTLVSQKMDQTFPLRRKEIVEMELPVKTTLKRWPALFTEHEVFVEFTRITCKNLQTVFFGELDRHIPSLIKIFKSKTGTIGRTLSEILEQHEPRINVNEELCKESLVTLQRTAVLRCIPVLLGDNASEFFKHFVASDDNSFLEHIPFGILTVISEESPHSSLLIHTDSVSTAIVIEGDIVMDQIKDMPLAVCLLFGLSYALNLDYPKGMKNTFYFIQQVLLDLGAKILKPKLQTLKNQLFS
ncbi:uncharacterized protein LOC130426962 [Triplophysa dalaica]|uniref:uncharacterized protein LOC130426962 n=1 Tax=Triplophysa dalaica TaxID=1582913 RepID=UPI0024DFF073|nr:uncharacterized protein LOC130426962 [Triplophysa dalaica]